MTTNLSGRCIEVVGVPGYEDGLYPRVQVERVVEELEARVDEAEARAEAATMRAEGAEALLDDFIAKCKERIRAAKGAVK